MIQLFASKVFPQELIYNGDFELYSRCPKVYIVDASYQVFDGWESFDKGTPDYYNYCGEGDAKVPRLWAGRQFPHSGAGFAGIYIWGKKNYREFLATTLSAKTIPGSSYKIRVSFALSNNSPFTCEWLGIRLLDRDSVIVATLTEFEIEEADHSSGWVSALFNYTAIGLEHTLVIGNFYPQNGLEIISVPRSYVHPMLIDRAYFYIDDVSFMGPQISDPFKELVANEPFKLKNVQFEFNESSLKQSSSAQLDSIAIVLNSKSIKRIIIIGHTDNLGDEKYNMELSKARAITVLNYLVNRGIDRNIMSAIGRGNTEPLTSNTTELDRSLNRRVTITFLDK